MGAHRPSDTAGWRWRRWWRGWRGRRRWRRRRWGRWRRRWRWGGWAAAAGWDGRGVYGWGWRVLPRDLRGSASCEHDLFDEHEPGSQHGWREDMGAHGVGCGSRSDARGPSCDGV